MAENPNSQINGKGKKSRPIPRVRHLNENGASLLRIIVEDPMFNFAFGLGTLNQSETTVLEGDCGEQPEIPRSEERAPEEISQEISEEPSTNEESKIVENTESKAGNIEKNCDEKIEVAGDIVAGERVETAVGENQSTNADNNETKNDIKDNENDYNIVYNDQVDEDDEYNLFYENYEDYKVFSEIEEQDVEEEEDTFEGDYNLYYNHDGDDDDDDDDDDENNETEEEPNEYEMFWNDDYDYYAFHQNWSDDENEPFDEGGLYYSIIDLLDVGNEPYSYDDIYDNDDNDEEEGILIIVNPFSDTQSSGYPEWTENGGPVIDPTEESDEDELFWNDDEENNDFDQFLDVAEHEYVPFHFGIPYLYAQSSGYPELTENGHPVIDLTGNNHNDSDSMNDDSECDIIDRYNENVAEPVSHNIETEDSNGDGSGKTME